MAKTTVYIVPSPITSTNRGVAAGSYEVGAEYQDPTYDNDGKQTAPGKLPADLLKMLLERGQAYAESGNPAPAKEGE